MVYRSMLNKALRAGLLLMSLPLAASAASPITFADLSIPPSFTKNGVAFFTVTSETDDALTGAASTCCSAVELHTNQMDGEVMRMRKVDSVPLKAGVPVKFAPGGLHVMLIGAKAPLKKGDRISVTFSFDRSPLQRVDFTVGADRLPAKH